MIIVFSSGTFMRDIYVHNPSKRVPVATCVCRLPPQGPAYTLINEDVLRRIMQYGEEESSFLFLNMVCKELGLGNAVGEPMNYLSTSAIMTSCPRVALAIDSGWDSGNRAVGFTLARASGSAEMLVLMVENCPSTLKISMP